MIEPLPPRTRYRSPLRPLDTGWAESAARNAGAPVQYVWDGSLTDPWTPDKVYAFTGPLPERFVSQWDLQEVTG